MLTIICNDVVTVVSTDDSPPPPEPQSDDFLPPWAVAVIVIGLASVAFVIVFGVSMVSPAVLQRVPNYNCDISAVQEAEDNAGPRKEWEAGAEPDRGDGKRRYEREREGTDLTIL